MDTESLVIGMILVVALVLIGVVVYFSMVDTTSHTAVFIRQYIPVFKHRLRPEPIPASGSVPTHMQPKLGPVPAHIQPIPIHGNVTHPMGYNTNTNTSTLLPGSDTEGFANAL